MNTWKIDLPSVPELSTLERRETQQNCTIGKKQCAGLVWNLPLAAVRIPRFLNKSYCCKRLGFIPVSFKLQGDFVHGPYFYLSLFAGTNYHPQNVTGRANKSFHQRVSMDHPCLPPPCFCISGMTAGKVQRKMTLSPRPLIIGY